MSKILKFFNLFGQTPGIKINGEIRPSSIFGSIIGFFTVTILTSAIFFILHNYFSRLSFTINSYTDNSAKPDINLKELKLGFIITDPLGNQFQEQERLFKISALFWEIYLPKYGENKTQSFKFQPIPTIKCNQYKNDSLQKEAFDDLYKMNKNQTCLDIPSLNKNLTGVYGKLGR